MSYRFIIYLWCFVGFVEAQIQYSPGLRNSHILFQRKKGTPLKEMLLGIDLGRETGVQKKIRSSSKMIDIKIDQMISTLDEFEKKSPDFSIDELSEREKKILRRVEYDVQFDKETFEDLRNKFYQQQYSEIEDIAKKSFPRFGIWDAKFLWFLSNQLESKNYISLFAYYKDDDGIKLWWEEASKLAESDPSLNVHLKKLEAKVQAILKFENTKDRIYFPEGVHKIILLSPIVVKKLERKIPKLILATGIDRGKYFALGKQIQYELNKKIDVQLLSTAGSIQNLDLFVQGKASALFFQRDAIQSFIKNHSDQVLAMEQGDIYNEFLFVLVNRNSDIKSLEDFEEKSLYLGDKNSGQNVTIEYLSSFLPSLKKVNRVYEAGTSAIKKVITEENSGMLFVGAEKNGLMLVADKFGDELRLIDVQNEKFLELKDLWGNSIYEEAVIERNTYPNLQKNKFFMQNKVNTLTVKAVFGLSHAWVNEYGEDNMELVSRSLLKVLAK